MNHRRISLHEQLLGQPKAQAEKTALPTPCDPVQVAVGKILKDLQSRQAPENYQEHPFPAGAPRHYFCKGCDTTTRDVHIPDSWYSLVRHTNPSAQRLGTYCSMACFVKTLPRLLLMDEDFQSYEPAPKTPRPPGERTERMFYCRQCGKEENGFHVPFGWYTITRSLPLPARPLRLGMYCSVACLARQMPRLIGIGRDLDERSGVGIKPLAPGETRSALPPPATKGGPA
jgi:hypothetical protein